MLDLTTVYNNSFYAYYVASIKTIKFLSGVVLNY